MIVVGADQTAGAERMGFFFFFYSTTHALFVSKVPVYAVYLEVAARALALIFLEATIALKRSKSLAVALALRAATFLPQPVAAHLAYKDEDMSNSSPQIIKKDNGQKTRCS